MTTTTTTRAERAFPDLPDWVRVRLGDAAPIRLRRFGSEPADLEIEFQPSACWPMVAHLISVCGRTADGARVPEDIVLDLPIGLQMEALLALAELSDRRPFAWVYRCGASACRSESEFELTVEELSGLGREWRNHETREITLHGQPITLRRPTGYDRIACGDSTEDAVAARRTVLNQLLVTPTLEALEQSGLVLAAIEQAVDEAMDEFDPLPGFEMQVICPECGAASTTSPSLTVAALQRLVGAQELVLDEIHLLASRYHWSEAEILRLPVWRREGYLQRMEQPQEFMQ